MQGIEAEPFNDSSRIIFISAPMSIYCKETSTCEKIQKVHGGCEGTTV